MTEIDRNKFRALAMACLDDVMSLHDPSEAFIAYKKAANPTTMLALLDQIDGLELGLDAAKLINKKNTELIAALEARNKRMEEALQRVIKDVAPYSDGTVPHHNIATIQKAREALESKP